jgi:ubiquitin-like protein Pup
MTERERQSRSKDSQQDEVQDAPSARGEEVAEKIDDLLDEIDAVLEENAEEFVKNYVQKGGE